VTGTKKHYFTFNEANAQIPILESTFARLLQLNAQLKTVYSELDDAGYAPDDEDFVIDPPGAPSDVIQTLATLRTLFDAARQSVESLTDMGCVVKQIEHGLVDWYAMRAGREVLLCWKLGEKSVGFWHEIDAGFTGRQSIATF
jgi:hypothetical protein